MAQPRALRRRARVAIVALLVLIVWTTKPERGLRLRRDRADRVAHLDPELKRAWDDDARAEPLPPRCERELAGALPLDRLEGTLARSRLYGVMASGVAERGLTAFDPAHANDAQTQGLSLSSLFTFDPTTGEASPVLRRLDVPVRAVVFPVPPRSAAARSIHRETRRVLSREFPPTGGALNAGDSVWYQDPNAYHFSAFHASHHLDEHAASTKEATAESSAIRSVARASCPIEAVIERVVVSPSGVVMALWNVAGGAEPRAFRDALRIALPRAPAKQIVADGDIMHTTVARLLRAPPGTGGEGGDHGTAAAKRAAVALTEALCGVRVTIPAAWFVHEMHALALALGGSYDPEVMRFECRGS